MTVSSDGRHVQPRWPTRAHALAAPVAVAVGALGVCAVVRLADPTTPGGVLPPCPTRALLGFTCPGCGSARMLYSLTHGDVPGALHYNALGLVALVLLAWSWGVWTAERASTRRYRKWQHWRWAPMVVLVVTVVWFVVRLLPFEPFRSLHV